MFCNGLKSPDVLRTILALGVLALTSGCGPSYPKTIPASGKVTRHGRPVSNGAVTFGPVGPQGRAATGILADDGSFRLTTFRANDGAMPGRYKVVVESYLAPDAKADPRMFEMGRGPPAIQRKYFQFDTSGLTATVDSGSNHFEFELP